MTTTHTDTSATDLTTEHLDVLIVGAGLSGIAAAHHVQTECPWASFAVFEARDAIGGTWDLFRYPGIRSDSDLFTLGYSFKPWPEDRAIGSGESILRYIRDTAAETGVDRKIRFHHRVVRADWSSAEACWHVTAERADTGETFSLTCSFLFGCTGYYRYDEGYLPEFPGIERFGGTLVHPQHWPEDLDYAGKRILVIGSGATAITLIPALARDAAHVTMVQRSPTYIVSLPNGGPAAEAIVKRLPPKYAFAAMRFSASFFNQVFYSWCKRRPEAVKKLLRKNVAKQLPEGYDIDTHFTPTYDPWDQRMCVAPDGDIFAAISAGDASVATGHIETFTETGLRLTSGEELDADIIITATGLQMLVLGGMALSLDGEPLDPAERLTYMGMMLDGVPNLALAIGYTNASWTLKAELTCTHVTRVLNHQHRTGLRTCTPMHPDAASAGDVMFGLSSGYVQRAAHLLPKQGSAFPWRVHDNYFKDRRAIERAGKLDDGALVFADPVPGTTPITTDLTGPPVPSFEGRVAAVTGAASGIGRALAVELARKGAHLALCDVDDDGLAETVALCEGKGVKVTAQHVDVADREAVTAWAESVVNEHGRVHLVVNNAGVALAKGVDVMTDDDVDWILGINLLGVINGTKAFLPHLKATGAGHIVNLSSSWGLLSVPGQSMYNATKFGVRGFTDALRMELEIEGAGVSATTVHPGGIRTNIARRARFDPEWGNPAEQFDKVARTSPADAARQILDGVQHNRRRVLIGADAKAMDLIARLPANWIQGLIVKGARRQVAKEQRGD